MGFFTYLKHDDNNALDALIVGASEDINFPASNAKILPVSKPYRSAAGNTTGQKLRIDIPVTKNTDQVILVNHNLTSSATITLNGGTTPDPDGGEFTTTMTWREFTIFKNLASTQTFKHWAVLIEDPTNLDGFIQVGYVLLGLKTSFTFGFNFGWKFIDEIINVELETEFGAPDVSALFRRVKLRLQFQHLSESQGNTVRSLYTSLSKNVDPFFLIPDLAVADGFFGRFTSKFQRTIGLSRHVAVPLDFTEDSLGKTTSQDPPFHYQS